MTILSTPLCFRSLIIYSGLLNDAHGDTEFFEDYLCSVGAWEKLSRERTLEFIWNERDYFIEMCEEEYSERTSTHSVTGSGKHRGGKQ